MFNSDIKKVEVQQKSKEWLKLRESYITASDIPAILAFKEGKKYYGTTPCQWVKYKLGENKKVSNYSKEVMTAGELSETKIVEKHFSNKEKFLHGAVFTRDIFLASLDVIDKKDKQIIELKYTNNSNVFEQYEAFTSPAYLQVALQMYVTGIKKSALVVNYNGRLVAFKMNEESDHYKKLIENIDYIKSIHESVVIKKENPFIKKASYEYQDLADAIESRKSKIKELKEEIEQYEERMVEKLGEIKTITAVFNNTEYKYTLQPSFRIKKVLKEGISEEEVFNFERSEFMRISKTKV